ncbi:hypothetical protein SynRS9909_01073 [Synechococcus sp. RS9909]|uniref:hypothetical protein n=1 Tax=unclassified Synechococcus TaxID=2626047 RepID=UPI0000690EAB|nr:MULTISPECIES: hypothetical protein [unclassified Synechococcus]EAQ68792.1 hypothetical protein RS9917_00492 [Synechococcus sp. RS9917]QNI79064.1 hypothetical protein SynRS9909_01073 [Synechococcus sp. RS9909]
MITTPLQQQSQKLRITYRVLWPNETSRVFISDASRTDAQLRVERWQQAWRSFTRSQWFPAPLTADQMQEQVEQVLRHSHPRALDLVVERIEVVQR